MGGTLAAMRSAEISTKFCFYNLMERNILEELGVRKHKILKWFLKG
jgi:hypothetical protein